jgi:hypothetical protein
MTNVARRPRGLKKVQLYGSKGSSSPYIGTGRAGQLYNIIGLPLREILLLQKKIEGSTPANVVKPKCVV